MAQGTIAGYPGITSTEIVNDADGRTFIKVYNGSGSALSQGYFYALDFSSTTVGVTIKAVATNAAYATIVGCVNNEMLSKSAIADGEYGWLQIGGACTVAVAGGAITAGHGIKVLNTASKATTESDATIDPTTIGYAKTTAAGDLSVFTAYLFPFRWVVV